jgi:hypothetical protein
MAPPDMIVISGVFSLDVSSRSAVLDIMTPMTSFFVSTGTEKPDTCLPVGCGRT